jgi:hypothetical protein
MHQEMMDSVRSDPRVAALADEIGLVGSSALSPIE